MQSVSGILEAWVVFRSFEGVRACACMMVIIFCFALSCQEAAAQCICLVIIFCFALSCQEAAAQCICLIDEFVYFLLINSRLTAVCWLGAARIVFFVLCFPCILCKRFHAVSMDLAEKKSVDLIVKEFV